MSLYNTDENSAYGVSLFERLHPRAVARTFALGPEPAEVLKSIKRNVTRILNTRSGESFGAPNLGLLDFNDAFLSTRDLSTQIQDSVEYCIHCYEPRLINTKVCVSTLQQGFTLHIKVNADVNYEAIHEKVELDIELNKSKKYIVY